MTSPPTILNNSSMVPMNGFYEGVSSIADANGNLEFYTDGNTVWDRTHVVMAGGYNLMGNYTSSQAALIIKQPGNTNIYFIFTAQSAIQSPTVGLRYSIVDMSLAAGFGSVTAQNILLYQSTTERLCATRHCNGTDIWVVTHSYPGSNFYAHLVSTTGVNAVPVITNIGFNVVAVANGQSSMKLSPTGKKLLTGCYINGFEVYDFDNSTGIISNLAFLGGRNATNVEFSPDGSKAYGTSADTLKQWDLCAGNAAAIKASKWTLKVPAAPAQLQIAPNGKVYVSIPTSQTLAVINNPNAAGAGCNYQHVAQSVAPNFPSYGFPQFMSSYFFKLPSFTFSNNPVTSCQIAYFNSPVSNVCPQVTYSISAYNWNFGDPSSGPANTSTLANPSHTYSAAGIYTAQLIMYNSCGSPLDTLKQQVAIGALPIMSNAGFSVCAGNSLTLTATGAGSYTWSTGATTSSIVISPPTNTVISITGTNVWGCSATSSQSITVHSPVVSISGASVVCEGSVLTLTASGANSYTWNTGATTSTISINTTSPGVYTLSAIDSDGCVGTQSINVTASPNPTLSVTGNTIVCAGSAITQTANGAVSYTWSEGQISPTVSLIPLQNTTYTVYGTNANGCSSQETITVTAMPLPTLSISGNTALCPGTPLTQTVIGATSYTWSEGSIGNTVTLSPTQASNYSVTGIGSNGCIDTASVLITVNTISVNNTSVCKGQSTILFVTAPLSAGYTYTWSPGSGNDTIFIVSPEATEIYTLTASNDNCTTKTTGTVTVNDCSVPKSPCEGSNAFSVPNAFSPNQDKLNDLFCLEGWKPCVTEFNIMIFDRWGEKVYGSDDPSFCWDGTYKGRQLSADVFVFIINATTPTQTINKKGNISLIR